jgi:allantoate deiminase
MQKASDIAGHTVMERCDLLASFSEEPDCITRRFATPPMHQVHETIGSWLRNIDMTVEIDAIGNLIGRYACGEEAGACREGACEGAGTRREGACEGAGTRREGACPLPSRARTLLLGSHLDTVRNAGKYDGLLGMMVALACLERLHARREQLPFSIELIGFADEEGLRYPSVYIGSKAITGTFDPDGLNLLDENGISLADALSTFGGNPDPLVLSTPRWSRTELLGYCEVHIEQGPVLEARNLPLAAVSSIVGQQRILIQLTGEPGHAGTLPMELRRDALCAAAEFVLVVETLGRSVPGLVATVGQLQVRPGACNVVPGQIQLSVDIRHEDDTWRERCASHLYERAQRICAERNIELRWQVIQSSQTIPCSPVLVQRWQQALAEEGHSVFTLPSGAGHDGVAMSTLTDIAMLFVRCRGGISHHPDEAVLEEDVAAAITVLERFLLLTTQEVLHEPV